MYNTRDNVPQADGFLPLREIRLRVRTHLYDPVIFSSFRDADQFLMEKAAMLPEKGSQAWEAEVSWEGGASERTAFLIVPEDAGEEHYLEDAMELEILSKMAIPEGTDSLESMKEAILRTSWQLAWLKCDPQRMMDVRKLLLSAEGLQADAFLVAEKQFSEACFLVSSQYPLLKEAQDAMRKAIPFLETMENRTPYFRQQALLRLEAIFGEAMDAVLASHADAVRMRCQEIGWVVQGIRADRTEEDERFTAFGRALYSLFPEERPAGETAALTEDQAKEIFRRRRCLTLLPDAGKAREDLSERELFCFLYRAELEREMELPEKERRHISISRRVAARLIKKRYGYPRIRELLSRCDPFAVGQASFPDTVLDSLRPGSKAAFAACIA